MADKIFINYRRVESLKDAQLLKAELDKAFGGKRVFLDVRGIDGGANWLQTLEQQVAASAAMVVLIGTKWADLKDEHGNRRLDDPHDKVRSEISQCPSEDFLSPLNHLDSMSPIMIRGGASIVDGQEPGEVRPRSLEISERPD
jgi:TIR domain